MATKTSKKYWEQRAAERMVDYMADAEKTANTLGKAYHAVGIYLSGEAEKVRKTFQNTFNLSEAEARRLIDSTPDKMIDKLKASVSKISDPQKRAEAEAIISSPAYAYRIQRMQTLEDNINEQCKRVYNAELKTDRQFFAAEADKAYKRTVFDMQKGMGISSAFDVMPESRINRILATKWSGEHFSDRVWSNTNALAEGLQNDMLVGIMAGKSEQHMAEDIMNRCGVGAFEARRLVRTETNYIANQAELDGYKECDIERYEFSACLDSHTSEICSELDGKVFPVNEAQPGVNLPPMHPFCRSTTLPILPSAEDLDREIAELGDEIGADVDFDEWVKGLQETEDGKLVYRAEGQKINNSENGLLNTKPGKKEECKVDYDIVNSTKYTEKFKEHYSNEVVSDAVEKSCKIILRNRDGTNYEEMFAIDAESGKILTYIKGKDKNSIAKTEKLEMLLTESKKNSIIIVHNHPNSATFSTKDVGTALKYPSIAETVAAGHNGTVYFVSGVYGHDEAIRDYAIAYTKYSKNMPDYEARNEAWKVTAEHLSFIYERK